MADKDAGQFDLAFTRLGNETEVLVNNTTVLRLPVKREVTPVGLYFHLSGVNARISKLQVHPPNTAGQ